MHGYRVFLYSQDHQNDGHVHVGKGKRVSKWKLVPVELVDDDGFNSSEIRLQRKLIEKHQMIIAKRWAQYWLDNVI